MVPRLRERDAQIAKSTLPSFRQLVQTHSKESPWEKLLTSNEQIPPTVAENMLDLCISANEARCLVHLFSRLAPGIQFSASKSKDALRMISQYGDAVDQRQLCRLLQPTSVEGECESRQASSATWKPPLNISVGDVNDMISTCLLRNDIDAAMKWFMTMQDVLNLQPLESTFGILLPSLLRNRSWDCFYYLLSEMHMLSIPIPRAILESLLVECESHTPPRWSYVKNGLTAILNATSIQNPIKDLLFAETVCHGLSVLCDAKQFDALLDTWEMVTTSERCSEPVINALLNHPVVLNSVSLAAIHLRRDVTLLSLLKRFLPFPNGESLDEALRHCLCSERNRCLANFGTIRGIGLGWLWANGRASAAANVYLTSENNGSLLSASTRAETVRILLACAPTMPSESIESLSTTLSGTLAAMADNRENEFILSSSVAENLIELFGATQNSESTALVLLHCSSQRTHLTEAAFIVASQTVLKKGEHSLVVQLLESYLAQLDLAAAGGSSETGSSRSDISLCRSPRVFSPAIQALAQMGDIESMMGLLLKEMSRRKCVPHAAILITVIDACNKSGQFHEGVRLFDLVVKSRGKFQIVWHDRNDLPGVVSSVLKCCAKGQLGAKALEICAWLDEKFPQFYNGANSELRDLELVVQSMANRDSISMLPTFLNIVSRGDRAVNINRRLFVRCLAASLCANNEDVYQTVMAVPVDDEVLSDIDNVKTESKRLAVQWREKC